MDKFKKSSALDQIMYYLSDDNITQKDVAIHFGCSLETVKRHFSNFKKESTRTDLIFKLDEKTKTNQERGKSLGGKSTNSGKKLSINDEELERVFSLKVSQDYTYEELSLKTGYSKSTLQGNFDRLKKINPELYSNVELLNYKHKRGL